MVSACHRCVFGYYTSWVFEVYGIFNATFFIDYAMVGTVTGLFTDTFHIRYN